MHVGVNFSKKRAGLKKSFSWHGKNHEIYLDRLNWINYYYHAHLTNQLMKLEARGFVASSLTYFNGKILINNRCSEVE